MKPEYLNNRATKSQMIIFVVKGRM